MEVKISEILELSKRVREIQSKDLKDLIFLDENGKPIEISDELIEQWSFTGMSNIDLIVSGFYKNNI